MHDTGQARFFVTIAARSADELRRLHEQDMDLFASTARRQKGRLARPFFIEGLLDEAEIETLRAAGYEVTVDAPMEARSAKPDDTLEVESWLDQMREMTAQDRTVK
jgi:hypothetical protein